LALDAEKASAKQATLKQRATTKIIFFIIHIPFYG
jgi:hypothetical protein